MAPPSVPVAIWAIVDFGSGRIGLDRRRSRNFPQLFYEQGIVRNVTLRLLCQAVRVIELSSPDSRMISGTAS
jgi:hypothetical protein